VSDAGQTVDLVIIGSGGGGLVAALAGAEAGLECLVIEKQPLVGGSTGMSGGVVWLPNNPLMREQDAGDSEGAGLAHLDAVIGDVGPASSPARRLAFLRGGSEMVELLRREGVRFERAIGYSDYYSDAAGGRDDGRSLEPLPFNDAELGEWRGKVMPGLASAIGFVVKTNELRSLQYFNRSFRCLLVAARVFARTQVAKIRRRKMLTNGSSLVGQTLKAVLAREVPVWLGTPFEGLVTEGERVVGVRVQREGQSIEVRARRGVLLAAGGFGRNAEMRRKFSGEQPNEAQWTVANPGDTGEVLEAAMALGAATDLMDEAWWLPSTRRELGGSTLGQARQRPGAILVNDRGQRFVNEANSMVEVGKAMYANGAVPAWILTDDRYRRRYANGKSRPGLLPQEWIDQGWVRRADTIGELARQIGLDPLELESTVARFNREAANGEDPEFGRGRSAYNRCMGDPGHKPNGALGPLLKPPFYAAELFPADVGTCGGLLTDEHARVLREDGTAIAGLYATGNITATVLGRSYPGAGASIANTMIFGYAAARHARTVNQEAS
jgi:3-oxosteroid 1-dehydrogenase